MEIKHYDKTFAVKLSHQRKNISAVARELGISSCQLTKWRNEMLVYSTNSFPGRGVERLTDEQREIKEWRIKLKKSDLDVEI